MPDFFRFPTTPHLAYEARAKLVRPDFAQAVDTHWRKRTIEWNRADWTQT